MLIDSKIALVTGGSRGIGRAIVELLAGRDYRVMFTYLNNEALANEVVAAVAAAGGEARAMRDTAWRYDGINGAWSDGLFPEVGLGLSRFENLPVIPGPRVGHAGHALGFTGGAWCDLDTGRGWAYWLSG